MEETKKKSLALSENQVNILIGTFCSVALMAATRIIFGKPNKLNFGNLALDFN